MAAGIPNSQKTIFSGANDGITVMNDGGNGPLMAAGSDSGKRPFVSKDRGNYNREQEEKNTIEFRVGNFYTGLLVVSRSTR